MKNRSKRVGKGSRDLLLKFLGPPRYLGNGLSYELQIRYADWRPGALMIKIKKIRSNGARKGQVTYVWHFRTACISRERFEIETSNMTCRLITGGTNNKNEK